MENEHDKMSFIRNFSSKIDSQNEHIFVNRDGALCKLSMIPDENGTISQVNSEVLFGLDRNVMNVCGNYNFHLILMNTGEVFAWGSNCYGQCGQDDLSITYEQPVQIFELENIIQISSGSYHGVALDKNGNVWRWGVIRDSLSTQLNKDYKIDKPYMLKNLRDVNWISCGQEHFYALDKYGKLWGYGSNYYKQLGDVNPNCVNYPVIVYDDFQQVMSVHTCCFESYGITKDNKLIRWIFKNTSKAASEKLSYMTPVIEDGLQGVFALATTDSNCIALLDSGELWSWGENYNGVLGQNKPYDVTEKRFFMPQKIENIPNSPIAAIISTATGLALYSDNEIWGWGCHIGSCTPMKIFPEVNDETRMPIATRTAYKDYYIGFLDILGFKDMILNREFEKSLVVKSKMDLLKHLDEYFRSLDTRIIIMSDSIVVTIAKEIDRALEKFLYVIAEINGMLNGSVLRGAIAFGELYHEDNIVFGPSFISAYQSQEYDAIFPRIIIKSEDINKISLLSEFNNFIMDKYFILDDDKKIFFDYLSYLRDFHLRDFGLYRVMEGITNAVINNYLGTGKMSRKISDKYKWLLKYIFIWNINNPEIYRTMSLFNFGIIHLSNCENISNLQDSLVELYYRLIIKFEDYILLSDNNEFPSSTSDENDIGKLIDFTRSNLEETVVFTFIKPNELFGRFGLKLYRSIHEKRPICEISHYTCIKVDSMELCKSSKYRWVNVSELSEEKNLLLGNVSSNFEEF